jgi:hypothetical protein
VREDIVDQGLMRRRTQQGRHLRFGTSSVKRLQVQLSDPRQPQRVGQPPVEWMAVRQRLTSYGAQQGAASIARPCNEVHQDVERALVGPLEVVNQEDHR